MSLGLVRADQNDPWDALSNWRHWSNATYTSRIVLGGNHITRRIEPQEDGRFLIDNALTVGLSHKSGTQYALHLGGVQDSIDLVVRGRSIFAFYDGCSFEFETVDPLAVHDAAGAGGDKLFAPMPGLVTIVTAKPGQLVAEGDSLIVLEAMKMEHTLRAPRDGIIAEVLATQGDQVIDGQTLLKLEPAEA